MNRNHDESPFGRQARRVALAALAGTALGASTARAQFTQHFFQEPVASAVALDAPPGGNAVRKWNLDADFASEPFPSQMRYAQAQERGAWAQANASLLEDGDRWRFGLVAAHSTSPNGTAIGEAVMLVEVSDPQSRDEVAVDIEFKAALAVQVGGGASWHWTINTASGESGMLWRDEQGEIMTARMPNMGEGSVARYGSRAHVLRNSADHPGRWKRDLIIRGHVIGTEERNGNALTANESPTFYVEQGVYVVHLVVGVFGPAVAVADPVMQPNAANPDVVVTVRAVADPSPMPPLFGKTAEDLIAEGFDPTPFQAVGFLGSTPSSSTTSSTTTTLPSTSSSTVPTTSTTTLPTVGSCPAGDAERLGCLCERGLGGTACSGTPVPPPVGRAFARACHVAAHGLAAGPGRAGRKTLARAAIRFARTLRTAERPRVSRGMAASCKAAVAVELADLQARTGRLAAGF